MSLAAYRRKRDPTGTPEPFTDAAPAPDRAIFVVQRHDARSLHYDFRLQRDGVLASWAVPKGVPLEPGGRALAVHVEDHPLSYATFEGEIPKGNYGAGTVEIWDHGVYDLREEKADGQLTVELHGERLNGLWSLVPAHLDGKPQNWLMIKRSDHVPGLATVQAPRSYSPMLATPVQDLPTGEDWLFEVKFDGYRALGYLRAGECRLVSRNQHDLTERFGEIAKAMVKATKSPDAVVDGEICRLAPNGQSSFEQLQHGSGPLMYYVFDLLELDGKPLVDLSLRERKARLRALLDASSGVRLSEDFDDGPTLLEQARALGLEGVVAKRGSSRYSSGKRSRDWLKLKLQRHDAFVVAGYTRGTGRRSATFGALVLAVNDGGELRHVGNLGTGFDDAELVKLRALLDPLARPSSPFGVAPSMPRTPSTSVRWVEPELVVEVSYHERTREGRLRHPAYLGLRDDRAAQSVTDPADPREALATTIRRGRRELKLSHLDKLYWPDKGITKGDLIAYYQDVAAVLVPHLAGRPFTMRRYPDGVGGKAFFQKDAPKHMPEWIATYHALVTTRDRARTQRWIDFPLVNDELALLWMVNMGCIDMNAWYSRVDKPDRPDYVVFDLDPTPEAGWTAAVRVALILKRLLDQLALRSFPKTSGGKGLHVLVPVARRATHDDTRSFARLIAGTIAQTHPDLATTAWSKAKRTGVLIDANQNGHGKTIASVYSVRPRPDASVSTPLEWDEVNARLDPRSFTMAAVRNRIASRGDLYAEVLHTPQSLARALASVS